MLMTAKHAAQIQVWFQNRRQRERCTSMLPCVPVGYYPRAFSAVDSLPNTVDSLPNMAAAVRSSPQITGIGTGAEQVGGAGCSHLLSHLGLPVVAATPCMAGTNVEMNPLKAMSVPGSHVPMGLLDPGGAQVQNCSTSHVSACTRGEHDKSSQCSSQLQQLRRQQQPQLPQPTPHLGRPQLLAQQPPRAYSLHPQVQAHMQPQQLQGLAQALSSVAPAYMLQAPTQAQALSMQLPLQAQQPHPRLHPHPQLHPHVQPQSQLQAQAFQLPPHTPAHAQLQPQSQSHKQQRDQLLQQQQQQQQQLLQRQLFTQQQIQICEAEWLGHQQSQLQPLPQPPQLPPPPQQPPLPWQHPHQYHHHQQQQQQQQQHGF